MAYFKEIMTKAVIGKGKKTTDQDIVINTEGPIDTVLGCWVINHSFSGINNNGNVLVNGSYDVNVWYSYDNNTKTNVLVNRFTYQDTMNVNIKDNSEFTNTSDIIIRSLNQPSVIDVNVDGNNINLKVHKEMGAEIVGDTKVRVSVEDTFDDYEEIDDYNNIDEIIEQIDDDVQEEFIN